MEYSEYCILMGKVSSAVIGMLALIFLSKIFQEAELIDQFI